MGPSSSGGCAAATGATRPVGNGALAGRKLPRDRALSVGMFRNTRTLLKAAAATKSSTKDRGCPKGNNHASHWFQCRDGRA